MEEHRITHQEEPIIEPNKKPSKVLIIILVVLIVLAIGGIVGTWYFMNQQLTNQKNQNQAEIDELNKKLSELEAKANATEKAKDEATKSYTTKYDKLKFNYPENWTLIDASEASTPGIINTYGIEGVDNVRIKSPDGFEITIISGGLGGFACPPGSVNLASSERVNLLGENYFLNYRRKEGTNVVEDIYVATKDDQCQSDLSSKSRTSKEDGRGLQLSVSGGYGENSTKTYEQLLDDPNIQAYKKFLQSLSY